MRLYAQLLGQGQTTDFSLGRFLHILSEFVDTPSQISQARFLLLKMAILPPFLFFFYVGSNEECIVRQ